MKKNKEAKNTFTLPGLGKLVLVNRVVKFRVAKAAKDAILGKR